MLIPGHVHVHLALEPVSLLKSIDGLCAEVERRFGDDPMHGHVFVFLNRSRTGATCSSTTTWLREGLVATLRSGRWDRARLRDMAESYGTKATLALVDEALLETEASARRGPAPRDPGMSFVQDETGFASLLTQVADQTRWTGTTPARTYTGAALTTSADIPWFSWPTSRAR